MASGNAGKLMVDVNDSSVAMRSLSILLSHSLTHSLTHSHSLALTDHTARRTDDPRNNTNHHHNNKKRRRHNNHHTNANEIHGDRQVPEITRQHSATRE